MNGPTHGYDLYPELRERLGDIWRIRTSHIYALLTGLEKDGLVTHERVYQETRPAKKTFSITEKGREVFLEWLASPVRNMRDIRLEFLAKLHFLQHHFPGQVQKLVSDQLLVCMTAAERLNATRRTCEHAVERTALNYRLAMIRATQSWLTDFLDDPRNRVMTDGDLSDHSCSPEDPMTLRESASKIC